MNQTIPTTTFERLAKPVPRYTSYPTAPHFHPGITNAEYRAWLADLAPQTALSLYVHVPFCDRLCWFCGCHTKQVRRYDPIAAYLPSVHKELETVADLLDGRGHVSALHLGGGSPSMLQPADLVRLATRIRAHFSTSAALEFSIEIDPNDMTPDRYDGFAAAGVSRISIGVQDFNPVVQQAINRLQSVEQTRTVVDAMRERGVSSVNLDVLYGLPHQTVESVVATVEQALAMQPDRIALFGYAHVPWMKTHQKMIDETALPGFAERLAQATAAAERIIASGFEAVGIDHFAKPDDGLAIEAKAGTLHRNFQGYTTDRAPALIGLGASSIGNLPQGYVQNFAAMGDYIRHIEADGLAVARGVHLSTDDRLRGYVIERLMCDFSVDLDQLKAQFGGLVLPVVAEMRDVARDDQDGFVEFDGDCFSITRQGRPFARLIASQFDAYLNRGIARHSIAV